MAEPQTGPCTPWVDADAIAAASGVAPEVAEDASVLASAVLWRLTGRRWSGDCGPVTIRPTPRCGCWAEPRRQYLPIGRGGPTYEPGRPGGPWGFAAGCACIVSSVQLDLAPVRRIEAVTVDGAALPSGAYAVWDGRMLVRLPDPDDPGRYRRSWPCCQRLDLPDTQVGTWSVRLRYGADVPADAAIAARRYGAELARAWSGQDCSLPPGVVSLARLGVSLNLLDPTSLAAEGRTGQPEVDAWLGSLSYATRNVCTITSPALAPDYHRT